MIGHSTGRVGLGLAALGRPAYLTADRDAQLGTARTVPDMRARAEDVLDAAYAGGVRYIDSARSYGRAEEFLAGWLASRPHATDVYVASKWGYRYVGDWAIDADVHEVKEHSLGAFESQLRETRDILGDRLKLYQVHSVTDESPVLSDPRLQYALARLRDEGVAVGFSTSGPHQADTIRTALDITVGGQRLFSSVQSTWNLLEPSAGPALADAHGLGVAVVVKECFANGRLAPGGDDATPAVRRAAHIAAGIGIGVDQLAIAAAIGQSWAPLVLSGAVSASQVGSHLDGAKIKLPPDVLIELAELPEEPADYWAARSRRAWT